MKATTKLLFTGAAALGAWSAYEFVIKPKMYSWGATPEECSRTWPGDEFTPRTRGICTRAVTIHAKAEVIWPWIMQTGQDRAGFYSYTWLENLFRAHMHNTLELVPEWQERSVGDDLWLAYKNNYGGLARMTIARLEPFRAMVTVARGDRECALQAQWAPHGCWNFILDPIDEHNTRLIMRSILPERLSLLDRANRVFFDPAHFIMERKMMLNIKRLAERGEAHRELPVEPPRTISIDVARPAKCIEPFTPDATAQAFDATAT
jgi:hypothetical protein